MLNDYIEQLNRRGSIPGLENIRRLLTRLGNPQEQVPVIHVAGTNGKGSVIAFMEAILREAGFRVGKYTSPTIASYYERFQLDGRNIDQPVFYTLLSRVKQEADEMEALEGLFPTAFDVETAVAFLFCQTADIMLLETGMGGRLDSTNVVSRPVVTVIASVSMDHMDFLGNTLEEIVREKAGILRKGVPCVSNPSNVRVEQLLLSLCEAVGAEYISDGDYRILETDTEHTCFSFRETEYEIHLPGLFQVDNAVTAIMAAEQAGSRLNKPIDSWCIKQGLKKAYWPVRLEHAAKNPDIYLDGAHNEDACIRLRESLIAYFADRPKIFIAGVLRDKEYEKMMAVMMPLAAGVFTLTPDSPRGLDGEILAGICCKYCGHVVSCESPAEAVRQAKKLCGVISDKSRECGEGNAGAPVIIAFGSLSYLGELKRWIE